VQKTEASMNTQVCLPEKVRVSAGSAVVLGLMKAKLDAAPSTAYLMTYRKKKCDANCSFCPQARSSSGRTDLLSRVSWPSFPTIKVVEAIEPAFKRHAIKRVCIQALNYPRVFEDLLALVDAIYSLTRLPISVSCQPVKGEDMVLLREAGIQRIGVALDAATREVFDKTKGSEVDGPYRWEKQLQVLRDATEVFGEGMVSTHLIVGIGETEEQMVKTIQDCVDMDVLPGLFAFTPIQGTGLAGKTPPEVKQYRRIQVAHYLILQKMVRYEDMKFNKDRLADFGVEGETLGRIVRTGKPFLTSGCSDCNRPYYNERPGGPIYNYPMMLTRSEVSEILRELGLGMKRRTGTN
jgi:biotin synthase-related radical SAM superfamily protein